MANTISCYFIIFCISVLLCAANTYSNPCDPTNLRDVKTLRPDQITVLINGYSESRIPLLQSIAATYASSPIVSSVQILWGNPKTSIKTLTLLSQNLSISSPGAPIAVIRQNSDSLNSRFNPRRSISTRAVLICDDDVETDVKSIEFAFMIWWKNRDKIVGFFGRSHDIDINNRRWIYTMHSDKYSIVLTKFMILKVEFLYFYSCSNDVAMSKAREVVDRSRNCEDILMNFVAAEEGDGVMVVEAERVRDWGDSRNEGRSGVESVGLSSRKKDHRKRRGECIMEFHRLLGRMPLRYVYGKIVRGVGEQGLCEKGGKLVACDHQLVD